MIRSESSKIREAFERYIKLVRRELIASKISGEKHVPEQSADHGCDLEIFVIQPLSN
jgi:hypothetical protein